MPMRPALTLSAALITTMTTLAADAPLPPHHRPGGFQNNYVEFEPKGLGALLRWK